MTWKQDFDQKTVDQLKWLKHRLGIRTDRQLAERLGISPSELTQWKNRSLPKAASRILDVWMEEDKSEGQWWAIAA